MPEVWRWFPQSIGETLQFDTDIRITRSAEWRDSLKDATQFINLGHVISSVEAEKALELVRLNAAGTWLVPEWQNRSRLYSVVASGSVSLSVDVPGAYRVGRKVFIGTDPDNYEVAEVAAIGTSDITLSAGTVGSYSGSVQRPVVVAPLLLSIMPNGVSFTGVFPVDSLSVQFMSVDPVDLGANSYPLIDGLPVVTDANVLFQPVNGSMGQSLDIFDSGFGAYYVQEAEEFTRRRTTISWYDKTPQQRWTRRRFLHYLRGRDAPFYVSSGRAEMDLLLPISAAALSLRVAPLLPISEMIGKVLVIREGNNVVARRVTGASLLSGNYSLGITSTGVAFSANASISLAYKSRLDADEVPVSYFYSAGDLASTIILPVVEVP